MERFLNTDEFSYLGANGDLQSFNLFAYCSNNPILFIDDTGHYTRTKSIGVNATALFGICFSVSISYDHHGNIAVAYSYALLNNNNTMYVGGLDAGVAVSVQDTILDNVDELEGKSMYVGASGSYMGYLGADLVALPDNYEEKGIGGTSWIGTQVSIGYGIGADFHVMETETVQSKSINPIKSFIGWLKSLFNQEETV